MVNTLRRRYQLIANSHMLRRQAVTLLTEVKTGCYTLRRSIYADTPLAERSLRYVWLPEGARRCWRLRWSLLMNMTLSRIAVGRHWRSPHCRHCCCFAG